MSYTADDTSLSAGEPVELYEFTGPGASPTIYRFTTYFEDVTFGGNSYPAIAARRSAIPVESASVNRQTTVTMPFDHPMIQAYAYRTPPASLSFVLRRYHTNSGQGNAIVQYRGIVEGVVARSSTTADVRIIPVSRRISEQLVATVTYQPGCNHVLYDGRCRISRTQHTVATTFVSESMDRLTINVATVDGVPALMGGATPNQYFRAGVLSRASDGERRLILTQVGPTLTILQPFPSDFTGSEVVTLEAGCAHDLATCATKFDNLPNYGGHPVIPPENLFALERFTNE